MTPAELDLYCGLLKYAYAITIEQTGLVHAPTAEALRDKMYKAIRRIVCAEPEVEKSKLQLFVMVKKV